MFHGEVAQKLFSYDQDYFSTFLSETCMKIVFCQDGNSCSFNTWLLEDIIGKLDVQN